MKERTVLTIKLISTHCILLPAFLLISFFSDRDSILLLSVSQTLLFILFLAGYWEFFGSGFRVVYSCTTEALIVILLCHKLSLPYSLPHNILLLSILLILQACLLFELIKIFIVILRKDKEFVEISFPLKNGMFLITDGGNSRISRLMNYHFYSPVHRKNGTNNSMKFATDIVRVDTTKKTFLPPGNDDYSIFGEKIYSPISGTVIKVENGIADNIPYSGNYPYNTGNTVVIKNNDYYFLIGHLKKGSIRVKPGDPVQQNDLIANAGNSGFSERPHIHMQLIYSQTDNYWKGLGVNISFQNKNLYKNRQIKNQDIA